MNAQQWAQYYARPATFRIGLGECTYCKSYAWHGPGQQAVLAGGTLHHPACPTMRPGARPNPHDEAAFMRAMQRGAAYYPSSARTGVVQIGTTAASVRAQKDRIDPAVRALDVAVATCTALTPAEKAGYQAFSASWRAYYDSPDSGFLGFGTGPLFDTGQAMGKDAENWQSAIGAKCGSVGPKLTDPDESSKGATDAVKWIGIGAAGVAAAIIVREFLR